MNLKINKIWSVCLVSIILLGIYIVNPVLLQSTKLNVFDSYQKFGTNYESKSLVLLDISDAALTKQGQWPWKRDVVGRAVINAYKNGAALVIVQVVFPHKDRLGGDEMFLKMITKYPVILTETNEVKNLQSISRKALAIGNVSVPVDVDGTIRKLPVKNSIPQVVLKVINFPDHYNYTNKDILEIKQNAKKLNAKIITTEKDYNRLSRLNVEGIDHLKIELKIINEKKLIDFLNKKI